MRCLTASLLLAAAFLPGRSVAEITPANVADLALKWSAAIGGVTGGPILRNGGIYVGSWDSHVYALDPVTGAEIWAAQVAGPIPGRVHVLDDGGICYGTLLAEVGCLNEDGTTRWTTSLFEPGPGAVWSAPVSANGRLFVGVASQSDQPCIRGRVVALDLADGDELWRFYTVPDKVCDTDTGVGCIIDGDCPDGGTCVTGRGGGVTASPAVDPTGAFVYMNTVGCFTFPSIGESDSMFKIDATNGDVLWRNRVNDPEQFGTCSDDTAVDCGVAGDCAGVGATCNEKAAYHDFGFVNGPLRIEVTEPTPKTLIVSASKNGTLYAFNEETSVIEWTNVVRATPVSPGFAGFGLFNGAITVADGRIYAALYTLIPSRVCSNDAKVGCNDDGDCPGGTCPPENEHLKAFDAATGATVWSAEIGRSWSHVAVANGIVFAGTEDTVGADETSFFYAHDAETGARLATFDLPKAAAARAVADGDTLYVGYGFGVGGMSAFSLCSNASVDPGEDCDPGALADGDCCSASCTFEIATACDDGDACTPNDQCGAGACTGAITTPDEVGCKLQQIAATPCGDTTLPAGLAKSITRALARSTKLLTKAATTDKPTKVERYRRQILKALDSIAKKATKAAASKKTTKRIPEECRAAIDALVTDRRALVEDFAF